MLQVPRPDQGVLFVVTGPSGVGKSTLVREALSRIPGLSFSVSATTRAMRPGERDGVDYHFVPVERFAELVAEDAFLEHATVYDRSYGTLAAPTRAAMADGLSILLDIDLRGARQVRAKMPDAVLIAVLPPSVGDLERRLRARATDGDDIIRRRMEQVGEQLEGCGEFDYLVVNDDLPTAHATFQGVLLAEMSRRCRLSSVVERVLAEVASRR